jgi:predicted transcriptional regulator with HTH domain
MNKKGRFELDELLGWPLAIFVLVLVLVFATGAFGGFESFFSFIPGINNTVDPFEDSGIIRYSILEDKVELLEGRNYGEISEKLVLNGEEFDREELRRSFADYYSDESLRDEVRISVSKGNIFERTHAEFGPLVAVPDRVIIGSQGNRYYVEVHLELENVPSSTEIYGIYYARYNGELELVDCGLSECLDSDEYKKPSDRYSSLSGEHKKIVDRMAGWRDSVVEKPMTIKGKRYGVEKRDDYLVVRLGEPISGDVDFDIGRVGSSSGGIGDGTPEPVGSDSDDTSEYTLDDAIEEVRQSSGDYSDNKVFVDGLYQSGFISEEEYIEINGKGLFNNEEDMFYVSNLLHDIRSEVISRTRAVEEGKRTEEEIIQSLGLIEVVREDINEVAYYEREGDFGKYYFLDGGHLFYSGTDYENPPRILLNDGGGDWWSMGGVHVFYTDFENNEFVLRGRNVGYNRDEGIYYFDELGNMIYVPEDGNYVRVVDPYEELSGDNWIKYSRGRIQN